MFVVSSFPHLVANASARDGAIMQYLMVRNFLAFSRVGDSSPCRISTREDRSHHVQKHRSIRSCAIHRLSFNTDKGQHTRVFFGASARRVLQLDVFWIRVLCIWNGNDVLAASSIFFWCEESSCRILGTFGALLRQRSHSEVVDGCFPPLYGGLKHAGNDYSD